MKISLITTVKNESRSILVLHEAIMSQTRQPDEWIIVDGGSTDGTVSKLKSLPEIKVLVKAVNIAAGRNHGIRQSSGEIVVVTDGGCRPQADWLEKMVSPLEQGRCAVTGGQTKARIEVPLEATQWIVADQFVNRHIPLRQPSLSSRSLAFLRRIWEETPYPEWLEIGEDAWLVQEWKKRGHRVLYIEEALIEWFQRSDLKSIWKQYFLYAWGDGRAGMHKVRHGFRLGFYVLVMGGIGVGGPWAITGTLIWGSYLSINLVRFPGAVSNRSFSFKCQTLGWLPLLLLLIDGAKLAGFFKGRWEALRDKKRTFLNATSGNKPDGDIYRN
jgi:glycosyltransferase involved in cell wall biosynthesis